MDGWTRGFGAGTHVRVSQCIVPQALMKQVPPSHPHTDTGGSEWLRVVVSFPSARGISNIGPKYQFLCICCAAGLSAGCSVRALPSTTLLEGQLVATSPDAFHRSHQANLDITSKP